MSAKRRGKKIGFQRRTARRTRQQKRRLVAEALEPCVMLSSTPPTLPSDIVDFDETEGRDAIGVMVDDETGLKDGNVHVEPSRAMASTRVTSDTKFNYVVGGLFPRLPGPDGKLNIITSDSLRYDEESGAYIARESGQRGILDAHLRVTTEPVVIPNVHKLINKWLIPQLTHKTTPDLVFSQYHSKVLSKWTRLARNTSIHDLVQIGYSGPGAENGATNTDFWNAKSTIPGEKIPGTQVNLYDALRDLNNYHPASLVPTVGAGQIS
jgi:hypothetical protein